MSKSVKVHTKPDAKIESIRLNTISENNIDVKVRFDDLYTHHIYLRQGMTKQEVIDILEAIAESMRGTTNV